MQYCDSPILKGFGFFINYLTCDIFNVWISPCRGLEIFNASRCFNCGSYNHSLKECPKPRDNVAVSNARKELKSKRNQSAGSRNPTRYYQSSPGGKYDGLRPGILDVETRKLLGLGVRLRFLFGKLLSAEADNWLYLLSDVVHSCHFEELLVGFFFSVLT